MLKELKSIKSDKKAFRNFGVTVGIVLLVVAGILFWYENESFKIILIIGFGLCFLGILIPVILKPIYWVWMIFATILGWIMTRLILSLLFYVIITPIALIARLFGKQFIELKWDKRDKTYWNSRLGTVFEKEKYEKQF